MNEPLKQRLDFADSLEKENEEKLKKAHFFDEQELEKFTPISLELEQDNQEGEVESLINEALKPKRSFWRKLVGTAVGGFLLSVWSLFG
ncbi:hypothetical protein GQR86_12615 [Providencia vermicola]|nr:hypothetical protein [Providencia sp. G1(2023)]MBC8653769.1 hypothetical protein [Providencia vermicola]